MIKSLYIENFKGFEKLKAENLSRVNLFGGSNNIGKTSILEAIFAFHDRLSPDLFLKQYTWRGLIPPVKKRIEHEIWLPVFNEFDLNKTIKINLSYDDNQYEELTLRIDGEFQKPLSAQDIAVISKVPPSKSVSSNQFALHVIGFTNNDKSYESFHFFSNQGLTSQKKVVKVKNIPVVHFLSTRTYDPRQDSIRFGELMRNNKDELAVKALKIIDPRITKISPIPITENMTILHGDIGLLRQIPINYLGDGILRLLSYILAILTTQNGIILIDEIENGFHYTKHSDIWKLLFELAEEYNVQIFANTHSFEMVRAFNEACIETKRNNSYLELFRHHKDNLVMSNYLDSETLAYKIEANKPFRGE